MNSDNIELADVAEVLAYIMSQEKVMAVPPVLIPTEGATRARKRPKKQPRNNYYTKKNPKDAHSTSDLSTPMETSPEFPIERGGEEVCGEPEILTYDEIPADEHFVLMGDHMEGRE